MQLARGPSGEQDGLTNPWINKRSVRDKYKYKQVYTLVYRQFTQLVICEKKFVIMCILQNKSMQQKMELSIFWSFNQNEIFRELYEK